MEKLEITGAVTPPKGKGLDVVKEFEDSKQKRSASFVVVGKFAKGILFPPYQTTTNPTEDMWMPERAL